jgi:hypothetical protein
MKCGARSGKASARFSRATDLAPISFTLFLIGVKHLKIFRQTANLSLFLALALSACGGDVTDTSNSSTGTTTTDAVSAVGAAAGAKTVSVEDLPDFATIYPEASVISNTKLNSDDQDAGNVSYSTRASVSEIVDFYKKSMAQSGLDIRSEVDSGGSFLISATNGDEGKQLNVTIIPNQEEDKRMVMMTHAVSKSAEGEQS